MTIHIHPTASLAERVLLPGDPGRALRLAQALLESPRMFNHNRGLWGYTGTAGDGRPLTIQSTGMGGPSAAIVIAELAELGGRRLVRVGTCGALERSLTLGDVLVVTEALSRDGTSAALGVSPPLEPEPALRASLEIALASEAQTATAVSTDLFYGADPNQEEEWIRAGAQAVDMETATLFALARRLGLRAAALLAVSDTIRPSRTRIDAERLLAAELRMGAGAAAALGEPCR